MKLFSTILPAIKFVLYFLTIIFLLLSCDDWTDDIYYHTFDPEVSVSSVRSYQPDPSPMGCDDHAVPNDSTASISIDFDLDGSDDLKFTAGHGEASDECGGHCYGSKYVISVSALHSGAFISTSGGEAYSETDVIHADSTWIDHLNIYYYDQCVFPVGSVLYEFIKPYLGISINGKMGWIRFDQLPLNGIQIEEYAMNLTEGNDIRAGQKE